MLTFTSLLMCVYPNKRTMNPTIQTISILDSHTGGEPTRLVLAGGPELGDGPLSERLQRFRTQHDHIRSAIICEPRGSDVLVGAMLVTAHEPECSAGLLFFNNAGYLGMCGHGLIGAVVSLAYLGQLAPGKHRIDTPVGVVQAQLNDANSATIWNVPAYRHLHQITIEVPGIGPITGDVAWGGNWFFLVNQHGQELLLSNVVQLTDFAWRVRAALELAGVRGAGGAIIDHVELFAPSTEADSKNFVLCPGRAYDRSPCGTGTSAKLACLAADGKLGAGQIWRQESITGSIFEASYAFAEQDRVLPCIRGQAHVMARTELLLDPHDPLIWGMR
jgi:4-hydroxyproline epimerase